MEMAAEGCFNPAIAARFALADHAAAMNLAFSGKAAGRVVLLME
jgi:NADPH2:quinone reductase